MGDIMSPENRSAVMSRIKGKDTGPEKAMAAHFSEFGLTWESHVRELPGRPDFVFHNNKLAVFVDGDFWHGWRFPQWRNKLTEKWEAKIEETRKRDARNHRKLSRMGWKVVRIWEHQIKQSPEKCVARVISSLEQRQKSDSKIERVARSQPSTKR